MDFTILIVGLFIGVGIPLRNKAIAEYRRKRIIGCGSRDKCKNQFISLEGIKGRR